MSDVPVPFALSLAARVDASVARRRCAADAYRSLAPAVLGYLRSQRVPEPEDVLGEVFLHVAQRIGRFRGDDAELRRWVFTITRRRVIDSWRRRASRPAVAVEALPDVAAAEPELDAVDPALIAAVEALTPDQRDVVLLRFVADLPLQDVARITGRPVGAVKALQHRALATLGRVLGEEAR
jgi:RNA polymerase sigma factor (sigma-70 family)